MRLLIDEQPLGPCRGMQLQTDDYPARFQCLCLTVLGWGTIDQGQKFATWWK